MKATVITNEQFLDLVGWTIEGEQIGHYEVYHLDHPEIKMMYAYVLNGKVRYARALDTKDWNEAKSYVREVLKQDYADMLHLC